MRVCVTGVGGAAGAWASRELIEAGHEVYAVDADPRSAAFRALPLAGWATVPMAHERDYLSALLGLCGRWDVDLIIPTTDEEVSLLSTLRREVEGRGFRVAVAGADAVALALDKLVLPRYLRDVGVPAPATSDNLEEVPGEWVVVKPRRSRGGRGVYICRREDAETFAKYVTSPIFQERLVGKEYSVDVFVAGESVVAAVPRLRERIKCGVTWYGVTVRDERVEAIAAAAASAVGIEGPANVQILGEKVIEINPRLPGTAALTAAAGVRLAVMTVEYFGLGRVPRRVEPEAGVRISRMFDSVIWR